VAARKKGNHAGLPLQSCHLIVLRKKRLNNPPFSDIELDNFLRKEKKQHAKNFDDSWKQHEPARDPPTRDLWDHFGGRARQDVGRVCPKEKIRFGNLLHEF
jgi:hypothetical protein